MKRFAVVIVAFNPDTRLLSSISRLENIERISHIVVVDNSDKRNAIIDSISLKEKIHIIDNDGNKGIAYAQNRGIEYLFNCGIDWVLTLDHDTIIEECLIEKYARFIIENECSKIGIICSDYYDVSTKTSKFGNDVITEIDETISSGSLINTDIFYKIGGMKDEYFIDQVDNEYCYRLRRNGYKIMLLPGADMEHKLGNIKQKSILGKNFCVYNQTPIRTYYRTRNIVLFAKEYKDKELTKKKTIDLIKDFARIMFEDERLQKYRMFLRGLVSGLKART